jgi:hypothetical protein
MENFLLKKNINMVREITSYKKFYLCQGGNWQVVVEADCEENAATQAVEEIMVEEVKFVRLSAAIFVKELPRHLGGDVLQEDSKTILFYTPMIMANAGFHAEAHKLQNYLDDIDSDEYEK